LDERLTEGEAEDLKKSTELETTVEVVIFMNSRALAMYYSAHKINKRKTASKSHH